MKVRVTFIILTCCMILSCKNSTQSSPQDFTNSTVWIYSDTNTDSTGKVISALTDTTTIVSSNISNSQKTLKFSDSSSLVLSGDGSSWTLVQFNPSSSYCDLSAFPGIAGDTIMKSTNIPLKIDGTISSGTVITLIKDVNVSVTAPAGNFSCSVYEIGILVNNVITAKILTYISASVGIVEKDYYLLNPKTGILYLSERKQLQSVK